MRETGSRWAHALLLMPWATLLPLWLPLPFLLSGAVRFLVGWSLGAGLGLCALAALLAVVLAARHGLPRLTESSERVAAYGALVCSIVLVAWTFRLWWSPLYAGLPNTLRGVDIGNHALIYQRFTGEEHAIYEGFVGLYALVHWYRGTLGAALSKTSSIYYGLRFAHYVCLLTVPVALALIAYPSVATLRTRRRQAAAWGLILPFQLAVLSCLIFPVLGYYQAEGFYSQIVGLYPLLLGWLCFGLVEEPRARFLLCMFWIVVQRFSYGLNLGDLLITLAYLWSWELRPIRPRWLRWGAIAFIPVALGFSWLIYSKLYPLRLLQGYFIEQSVAWVLGAQVTLSIALLAAPSALRAANVSVSDASVRLWRFAGTFGLVNGAITTVYFAHDEPLKYYILKYGLYPIILVLIASIGPISCILAHMVSSDWRQSFKPEPLRLALGALFVSALVSGTMMHGHLPYREMAIERYERTVPNAQLFSHYERKVDKFIDRTLEQRGNAQFGGYYDPFWPRMFSMNALRFLFSVGPDYNYNRAFERSERMFEDKSGHCYFYLGDESFYHGAPTSTLKQHIATLRTRQVDCAEFRPHWAIGKLAVCAACL